MYLSIPHHLLTWAMVVILGLMVAARAESGDAQDCLSKGHPATMIAACTRLIESQQLSELGLGRAYLSRAAAERDDGQLDIALRDVDAALRLDPKSVDAHMMRSTVYKTKRDLEAAIREYNTVLQLQPNHIEAHANRGASYMLKHNIAAALLDFDAVVRLDPQSSAAYYQRGMAYRLDGQHIHAFEDFTTAVRLAPGNPLALTDLATCYLDGLGVKKDVERGAELLAKAAQTGFPPAKELLTRLNQRKP
jgi:tetratricopeptide (TPR) repeat protein